jgi:putative ATPase
MEELGYGTEYQYSHDFPGHFIEQQFLPDNLKNKTYYKPGDFGREKDFRARLNAWWKKKQRS